MRYGGGGRYGPWIKKGIYRNDVDGLCGGNLRLQSVSLGGACRAAARGTGADGFRGTGRSGCRLRNREQIGELLSILADMEPTNLQSVQDVPQADAYTSIHFEDTEGRVYTIFYYETDGTEYVEQSCQGIYKPAPALGELLDDLLESGGTSVE